MTYEEFKKLQYKAENKEGNLLTEEELNILKPYKRYLLKEKYDSYRKLVLRKL